MLHRVGGTFAMISFLRRLIHSCPLLVLPTLISITDTNKVSVLFCPYTQILVHNKPVEASNLNAVKLLISL